MRYWCHECKREINQYCKNNALFGIQMQPAGGWGYKDVAEHLDICDICQAKIYEQLEYLKTTELIEEEVC